MKIGQGLKEMLNKKYEPGTMIETKFKGNDISFKTDSSGNPILLFIGKRDPSGTIRGKRFIRFLKYDKRGEVIKDHWDLKGKAS